VILTVTDKTGQKHIFQGQKAVNTQALTDYSWSYQPENTKKPIVLNFTNDRGSHAIIVDITSAVTMVLFSTFQVVPWRLQPVAIDKPFELNTTNVDQPTLTVSDAQGQKYTFTGKMTPEALFLFH
jgi:hypothetical protein